MTVYTEGMHTAEFFVSEAEGTRSREEITVGTAVALAPGSVLGVSDLPGTLGVYRLYNPANVDGSQVAKAILYAGVAAGEGTTVPASGRITFTTNPSADATIAVNGVTFTAKASGATGAQFNIGANLAATMIAAAAVLNASVNASVAVATYTATADSIEVVHDTAGAAGNAFTLAASVATPSAATLLGGGYAARAVVFARDCEVNAGELTWFSGASAGQKTAGIAELANVGIIARSAI